jgi:hypothetical protein
MMPLIMDFDNSQEIKLILRKSNDYELVASVLNKKTGLPFDFTGYRMIVIIKEKKTDQSPKIKLDTQDETILLEAGLMTWKFPKEILNIEVKDYPLEGMLIKNDKRKTVLVGELSLKQTMINL